MGTVRLLQWLSLLTAVAVASAQKFQPIPIADDLFDTAGSSPVPLDLTATIIKHVRARLAAKQFFGNQPWKPPAGARAIATDNIIEDDILGEDDKILELLQVEQETGRPALHTVPLLSSHLRTGGDTADTSGSIDTDTTDPVDGAELEETEAKGPSSGVIQGFRVKGDLSNKLIFLDIAALRSSGIDMSMVSTLTLDHGSVLVPVEGLRTMSSTLGAAVEQMDGAADRAVRPLAPRLAKPPVDTVALEASPTIGTFKTFFGKPKTFFNKKDNSANFAVQRAAPQGEVGPAAPGPFSFSHFQPVAAGTTAPTRVVAAPTPRLSPVPPPLLALSAGPTAPLHRLQALAEGLRARPVASTNVLPQLDRVRQAEEAIAQQPRQPEAAAIPRLPTAPPPAESSHTANVARVLAAQEALRSKNEAWAVRNVPGFVPSAERRHAAQLAEVVAGQQEVRRRQEPHLQQDLRRVQQQLAVLPGYEQHQRQVADLRRAEEALRSLTSS